VAGSGADRTSVRRRARLGPAWTAAGAAVALGGDVVLDPSHRHVPLCPFRAVTGWWCPLCGGLRCADALVHGHIDAAVHDNIVFLAVLPLLLWAWVDWVGRVRAGQPARRLSPGGVVAVVAVLIAFTLVRNLPPASALRPG
jgi:hypothetical protein